MIILILDLYHLISLLQNVIAKVGYCHNISELESNLVEAQDLLSKVIRDFKGEFNGHN